MRNKGFTLTELLAVIVILAVIALIATPMILGVIESSKKGAAESSAYGYMEAIENSRLKNVIDQGSTDLLKDGTYDFTNIGPIDYKGTAPKNMCVVVRNGRIALGSFEFDSYLVDYDGTKIKVNPDKSEVSCNGFVPNAFYKDPILNGADPVLEEGMIPIYFDGNTVKKADIHQEWYRYANKEWANMILVGEADRDAFKALEPGTAIDMNKVLAYFVWVPRYKHAFPIGEEERIIRVIFENKNASKANETTVDPDYLMHPAFTFGTTELNGFWVSKFEPSTEQTSTCYTSESEANCNNTSQNPRILPNVKSLRYQQIANQFLTAQKFKSSTYGYRGDSRMMKNMEWGAVAYLSHSIYGIQQEIRSNNNSNFITGCGAKDENAGSSTSCEIIYGEATDFIYSQSTTGNITGIFDMSGGAWEYVMGVLADSSGQIYTGRNSNSQSGFNGIYGEGGTFTTGISLPSKKYYDLYTIVNQNKLCNGVKCLGDATMETSKWYGDYSDYVTSSGSWFSRGGYHKSAINAGIFSFTNDVGNAYHNRTFRVVLSEDESQK